MGKQFTIEDLERAGYKIVNGVGVRSDLVRDKPPVAKDSECPVVWTLPYPPSVNEIWIVVRRGVRLSNEARKYRADVAELFKGYCVPPTNKIIAVTMNVFRPRRVGDLDNCAKAVLDSLNKILYVDDRQIDEIHLYRHDDKHTPRVEVEIREQP